MTTPGSPPASFEEHFAREIAASERLRVGTQAVLVVALAGILAVLYLRFHGTYLEYFSDERAARKFGLILGGLLVYELLVFRVIGQRMRAGETPPQPLRYLNALVETSVPSLLILAIARDASPVYVMQSGVTLLYGVFIVLSTLRLDVRLSVFTGLVAAVEYVALSVHFADLEMMPGTPFDQPPFYLAKGAILLLSGLAAGFVAHQLKRRIGNAWRVLQERARLHEAFGQQVSPEIVDELLRQGGAIASRRGTVCVMFMDIRDFTPLVEHKSPEEIVALQNAVFGAAVEVVNAHRGIINQFLGDGLMATFGAPLETGRDSANALAAARALVAAMRQLAAEGRIPPVRIGVGLHTGEAVTGNIGSAQRQQYSISGNVVILAARIEQLNKAHGSQILVSREVLAAAGEAPPPGASLGLVHVKGREQAMELFRLA
ncbi:MAG: adenylate/guanylate cyclase domain-containing protein [Burkholderiales bacterium]|nr:adenylate/guanylate cyclase domain-containing protein [Burkholderiales bacterium]